MYERVTAALATYFVIRRNVISERAGFNITAQPEGEPVDDFITSVYRLIEYTLHMASCETRC